MRVEWRMKEGRYKEQDCIIFGEDDAVDGWTQTSVSKPLTSLYSSSRIHIFSQKQTQHSDIHLFMVWDKDSINGYQGLCLAVFVCI